MEYIAAPLKCVNDLLFSLRRGESMFLAVQNFLREDDSQLKEQLRAWMSLEAQPEKRTLFQAKIKSPYRQALLDYIERGLSGKPVVEDLEVLQEELMQVCSGILQKKVSELSIIGLFPMFVFVLPAIFLVFLGPLVSELLKGF